MTASSAAALLASVACPPRATGPQSWSDVADETWVSVDVETSGPTPSTGSLLSIGACLVERPEEGIELLLRPDPSLPWSAEATAVHHLDRTMLEREGLEPAAAMAALEAWLAGAVSTGSRPVFVALNAPFDWMFVADAFWRDLGRNPFGISALDIKALYLGRHLGEAGEVVAWADTRRVQMLRRHPVDLPHTHRALDDAREQAALCRAILGRARR
jgi:ribonuclease T